MDSFVILFGLTSLIIVRIPPIPDFEINKKWKVRKSMIDYNLKLNFSHRLLPALTTNIQNFP